MYNDPLPEISGPKVDELRSILSELKIFIKKNKGKGFGSFEKREEIYNLYYNHIPQLKRFQTLAREYSNEYIKHLADVLGYESLIKGTVDRAK